MLARIGMLRKKHGQRTFLRGVPPTDGHSSSVKTKVKPWYSQWYPPIGAAQARPETGRPKGQSFLFNQYIPTSVFQKNTLVCQMAASPYRTMSVNLWMIYRRIDLNLAYTWLQEFR